MPDQSPPSGVSPKSPFNTMPKPLKKVSTGSATINPTPSRAKNPINEKNIIPRPTITLPPSNLDGARLRSLAFLGFFSLVAAGLGVVGVAADLMRRFNLRLYAQFVQTTFSGGNGCLQAGQGGASAAGVFSDEVGTGVADAGFRAAAASEGRRWPGMRRACWHLGHFTRFPANLSGAANFAWQRHVTEIGIAICPNSRNENRHRIGADSKISLFHGYWRTSIVRRPVFFARMDKDMRFVR